MPNNWLVTGGCGFVGVNLIKRLLAQNAAVRVLDDLSAGTREDLAAAADFTEDGAAPFRPGRVALMVGDVRDPGAAARAVAGADVVVHLAAQTGVIPSIDDPVLDCGINVIGTLNMLAAARDARAERFVFASSSAPLGDQEPPVHEGKVPRPLSPYGAAKLAGEAYCSAFHGSYGLNTVALRFSNVYGPHSRRKGSVVALFFRRALAGEPLVVYGDGTQTRDFIYTGDLCSAVIAGAERKVGGEVFQIASGIETGVNALADKVGALVKRDLGRKVRVFREPARKGEIYRSFCDISKAKTMLGFEPQVMLDEGLESTWAWFREIT